MNADRGGPNAPRILRATVLAAVAASVILVTVVLPAEYGLDPLGTGRMLGLTRLADPAVASSPSTPPAGPVSRPGLRTDEFEIELRPFEGVEYKYRLEAGAALVYEWIASTAVEYDFHGEPDGSRPRDAESYEKGTATDARGTFTAAKPGIHGWFWKNRGTGRVKVTLRTAGFYSKSITFHDGERREREFPARDR